LRQESNSETTEKPNASSLVSLVVPVFNEVGNIEPLIDAIDTAMPSNVHYEFIFIDDGSNDGTVHKISAAGANRDNIRLIVFTRNFGHQAAIMAGIEAASGDAVITLDADLQHPPRHIPTMIEHWLNGAVIVQMVRQSTANISLSKRLFSSAFYKIINWLSYTPVQPNAADFRLLDRVAVEQLKRMGDREPFLRATLGWLGFETKMVEFSADKRHAGKSSYSLRQNLGLVVRSLTSLSKLPLRISLYLGLLVAVIAVALGIFATVAYVNGNTVPGWTSIVIPVFFIGAVQLVILGVIGEYLGILYDQSRRLPTYVAYPEEKINPTALPNIPSNNID